MLLFATCLLLGVTMAQSSKAPVPPQFMSTHLNNDMEIHITPGALLDVCSRPGGACSRLKRAVEAIADAFTQPQLLKTDYTLCDVEGEHCSAAADRINSTGSVIEAVFHNVTQAQRASTNATMLFSPPGVVGLCGVPGLTCGQKRQYSGEVVSNRAVGQYFRYLTYSSPAPLTEMIITATTIPAATPAITLAARKDKKGKDATTQMPDWYDSAWYAQDMGTAHYPLPILYGWCGFVGGACFRKRSMDADLAPAVLAARSDDPAALVTPCYGPGGECAALLTARAAVRHVRRAPAPARGMIEPCPQVSGECGHDGEFPDAEGSLVEDYCDLPYHPCSLADRALDEIEAALDLAVRDLLE